MKRTTIKDIARESGVSLSTVSLVLNNNPRISEATRKKVLAVVEKYGYEPNINARGLASRSSHTLSVVVPHLTHVFADVYFGEIVSGIYERAASQGFKLLLDIANKQFIDTEEYLKLLRSRRADAMLFIASSIHDSYLRVFEDGIYNFLLVNHYFPNSKLNYMMVDYKDSARKAAAHLLGFGHKHIGLIAGTNTYTGLDFRDEFIRACQARLGEDTVVPWADGGKDWSQEGGFEATRVLLSQHPGLTAIMAANDRLAMGAMRFILDNGMQVPRDISVMGVDDIPAAMFTNPGLTTVRHDLFQLGVKACDRVLQLLHGESTVCHEHLPVTLMPRASTGPVRARA